MDVYLINLDRHPQRYSRIEALLAPTGLKLHRVRAIDGARLIDPTKPAAPRPGALLADRTVLSRFEVALVLSHRRALRQFLRTEASHAVVLEDDVYFGEQFADFVRSPVLKDSPFDVIKLETFFTPLAVDSQMSCKVGDREVARLLTTHMGAAGYMVSRQAARRILTLSAGAPLGMDSILFDLDRVRFSRLRPLCIGQVFPALVVQHDVRKDPAGDPELTSWIGARRGHRVGKPKPGLRRMVREIARPFEQIRLMMTQRVAEFR